jgi:hypothetical protein
MDPALPNTPSDFKSFLEFEKEVISKIEKEEPFFIHVFIDIFPDITCILSWPILKETALFKKISKNIDSIALCIIISTLAATSISSIGLFYCEAITLKVTFAFIHISAQTALTLLSGAYLKKHFLLKRNHEQVKTILVVVKALFKQIHDLSRLNDQHKDENKKQAVHNEKSKEVLKQFKVHEQEQIIRHAQDKKEFKDEAEKVISALKKAPEKLERILGQIELLTPTAHLLSQNADDLKKRITRLEAEHQKLELQNALLTENISTLNKVKEDLAKEAGHLKDARSLLLNTCQLIQDAASDLPYNRKLPKKYPITPLTRPPEYVLA